MAPSIVSYGKALPEIPGRRPWEKPTSFLVRDPSTASGYRVDTSGRRPSSYLLVPKLRQEVDRWREEGYPGASEVTARLLAHWFDEEHEVAGFPTPFRFHFCQREAIETLVWLLEIAEARDAAALIQRFVPRRRAGLFAHNVEVQVEANGTRVLRRHDAEGRETGTAQTLAPPDLPRYAFGMATGSGKTWVMAMALVWARFHKQRVPGSRLSTNFLIVAPNVIVYERLERDFGGNRIFHELPLIPPEWKGGFAQKVILRGDPAEPDASGNLFLVNVQQLYERPSDFTPANAVERLLGPKPAANAATSTQRRLLDRIKSLPDLVVCNDEAHHVHDEGLAWHQALTGIHERLPNDLSLWLDFSATPRDQGGTHFAWTVCDYPLAQAVEDQIVKAPIIVTRSDDPKRPTKDPDNVTAQNAAQKYGYWLQAAVERWREHEKAFAKLPPRPVLFVMVERNVYADAIGRAFVETFGFQESEVLIIHTASDKNGEVREKDLEDLRKKARDVDQTRSKIKVIVSVLMLREGWDVRNVSVVLGLRPFTAQAEILPEQVIGRGLRRMQGVGPDVQTLEVLGTHNLLENLRQRLAVEGVAAGVVDRPRLPAFTIYPMAERVAFDIALPRSKPTLSHQTRRLEDLEIDSLAPIYTSAALSEPYRLRLQLDFAVPQVDLGQADVLALDTPMPELLSRITDQLCRRAGLTGQFAAVFPIVRSYLARRCFGREVDLDSDAVRSHLEDNELREGVATFLASAIGRLTAERKDLELAPERMRLRDTATFHWRRDLPPPAAKHTIFNAVATYNKFERTFAKFLDDAADVLRFASLGTTEQGESGTVFRIDYLKPSGAIGFYHPDWVAVQRTPEGEVHWILETKGREWEDTPAKDEAAQLWCGRVSAQVGQAWRFARIDQVAYQAGRPETLGQAVGLKAAATEQPSLFAMESSGIEIGDETASAEESGDASVVAKGASPASVRPIQDYETEELIEALASVTRGEWIERSEAVRRAARRLGFQRTGHRIDDAFRSALRTALRRGRLEASGRDLVRAARRR